MGYFARRLNELTIGQFIVAKVQWSISIIIMLKVFNAEGWVYIISIPIILLATLLIGIFVQRSGLWDRYIKESLRGIR